MVCCCGVERVLVVLGSCVGFALFCKTHFAPVYLDPSAPQSTLKVVCWICFIL